MPGQAQIDLPLYGVELTGYRNVKDWHYEIDEKPASTQNEKWMEFVPYKP
jgi:hypothetical protein